MEYLQRVMARNPLGRRRRRQEGQAADKVKNTAGKGNVVGENNKGWRLRTSRTPVMSSHSRRNGSVPFTDDSSTFRSHHGCDESATQSTMDHNIDNVRVGTMRKKEIPVTQQYAYMSNHVVVNQERTQRKIPFLTRCSILDEMARGKALEMASQKRLLQPYASATMEENVERGPSLQIIHQLIMHGLADNPQRANILSPRFVKFGMGTARGKDGNVYMSQLFQGPPARRRKKKLVAELGASLTLVDSSSNLQGSYSYSDSAGTGLTVDGDKEDEDKPLHPIARNIRTRPIPAIGNYIPPIRSRKSSVIHVY